MLKLGPRGPTSAPLYRVCIQRHDYIVGPKSFNTSASSIIVKCLDWKYVHSELNIALVSNFQNPPMLLTQV